MTVIQQHIADAGGKITFKDFMQLCLYQPGLGYYSVGTQKFGPQGDFTTAPEISPLFSKTLAQHSHDVLTQLDNANILEFGAGSGKMAGDLLQQLEQLAALPKYYFILEASADLRQRQQSYLQDKVPHLMSHIQWLDALPTAFSGVVLANEVCDAMPVHRLQYDNGTVQEYYVQQQHNELQFCLGSLSSAALETAAYALIPIIGNQSYTTEINLNAQAWLSSLANHLEQGAIFIIDYGYPRQTFYHPQRHTGTLACYYQHQAHDNPLILAGLQDITCHVEFTSLAETAVDNGLDVAGFQSQADFLLAGGITDLFAGIDHNDEFDHFQQATELKRLTLPSTMGEEFKALTLTKNLPQLLPRLQLADRRHGL